MFACLLCNFDFFVVFWILFFVLVFTCLVFIVFLQKEKAFEWNRCAFVKTSEFPKKWEGCVNVIRITTTFTIVQGRYWVLIARFWGSCFYVMVFSLSLWFVCVFIFWCMHVLLLEHNKTLQRCHFGISFPSIGTCMSIALKFCWSSLKNYDLFIKRVWRLRKR